MANRAPSVEKPFHPISGFVMLLVELAMIAGAITLFVKAAGAARVPFGDPAPRGFLESPVTLGLSGVAVLVLAVAFLPGFFVTQPNVARVLVLLGRYRGSVRDPGFWWTNPFTLKTKVSLRAHNLNGERLKVNDLAGNPIEIAAVVVWQIRDTAEASFDVEKVEQYVQVQSESAVRHLASLHPYDDGQVAGVTTSLRGSAEDVARELQIELAERLGRAGVEVLEARLSHLAYAPEIASAMLQRQQAAAVIAARRKIVEGAVGMVEEALAMLTERKMVALDDERRAAMVGNLLVVLCGHGGPQPIINTGSLYS
jgi:regulator of protease activity HflC (stomatin/prohibitin superfamily)